MPRTTLVLFTLTAAVGACSKPAAERAAPAESRLAPPPASAPVAEPTAMLAPGASAPDISAVAHDGKNIKLSDFRGKPVVVYFYPKDDTPGCTIEAQEIRDVSAELGDTGAVVLGVSTQDNDSHRAFATKHALPFLLLPDTDHAIARAFGVPIRNGYAKRVTFVIDRAGKIAKVFPEVNPRGHAAELLSAVRSLGAT
jgi:peroxiredoxin Q/BCP